MGRKLYRSRENRVFSGVCGGLGEYFDVEPIFIRIIWVIISLFGFLITGIIVYIIAVILIPLGPEPGVIDAEYEVKDE